MRQYLLILLLALSMIVYGQTNSQNKYGILQMDSLKRELTRPHSDSIRAEVLRQIGVIYLHINPDSCIFYAEQAIKIYQKTKNYTFQTFITGWLGEAYIKKGNLPRALEVNLNAIDFAEEMNLGNESIGPVTDNLGQIYFHIGDYETSLKYYRIMTDLGDEDILGMAYGFYGIAKVFERQNQLDSALINLEKSFGQFTRATQTTKPNIITNTEYWNDVDPAWYNIRAKVYLKQNKPSLALEDLRATLKISIASEEIFFTINTYNDISALYRSIDQRDSSIYYAEKSVNEANKITYIQGILTGSKILAELYESTDPKKALYYYKLASEAEKKLYGAGNIQVMRDMIEQNESKKQELALAEKDFKDRLRMNALLGSTFTLLAIAFFLYRNNKSKQRAKKKIEEAFDQLKDTQSQLIQSEKMASLGELTAGIAHEIQNPLNFVNNFSDVNKELADELEQEIDKGNYSDAKALAKDIKENEEKINHHGKRADAIVKGMLQHSRSSSGTKEPTDINALADEYLRLAYHGLRAKDKSFNATIKTDFDETIGMVNVVPQGIGRVILNLITNAFYVVNEKSKQSIAGYEPTVTVSTNRRGAGITGISNIITITVKDNGNGIPQKVLDKIFQPFFTTKPTGQGTGLGLSLAYDIVKAHGGELRVETKEAHGSTFTVQLQVV